MAADPASTQPSSLLRSTVASVDPVSYDEYVSRLRDGHRHDADEAKEFGIQLPPFDLYRARMISRDQYTQWSTDRRFQALHIEYRSDGLKVVAYIFKPVDTAGRKFPTIFFNRGGHGELGMNEPEDIIDFHPMLDAGFVLFATQYRGSDGGEGKDEFGGADVHDVLNLIDLAKHLDYVDPKNLFMYGVSRGGNESFLALKSGAQVNAVAVVGASSDEIAANNERPLLDVYRELVPNFDQDPPARFRERSALFWAEKLTAPIMLLHGGLDWRNAPTQSLRIAEKLQALHQPYDLHIFADDDHSLSLHWPQRDQLIIDWFRTHMK